jgi:ABC-type branched-subunit amino acid transport system substrate-binding protein
MERTPIKVGVISELTGPLSFMGIANANVCKMVIEDMNEAGGLLGRPIELIIEDGQTDDDAAKAAAAKLVHEDKVDLVVGGIFSSTRQAIRSEATEKGNTLYIYPEQYEGQETDPLIFCTGAVPAQQVEPLIPWLMKSKGAKKFYFPSADYIWPHLLNRAAKKMVAREGGVITGEEYFPLDHTDYGATIEKIMSSGTEVVFNTIVPPGLGPFLEELHKAGFIAKGGKIICTYFDENFLNLVPAEWVEGLYSCLDYYQAVSDPFSKELLKDYNRRFPGSAMFTAGSGCSGHYKGLKLWEMAVRDAGTLDQAAVIRALDHASINQAPGGPVTMVPGQHHLRQNMYIAQARNGKFEIVKDLGAIDPKETSRSTQPALRAAS